MSEEKQLIRYCELLLRSFVLMHKSIEERTSAYDLELDKVNREIKELSLQYK